MENVEAQEYKQQGNSWTLLRLESIFLKKKKKKKKN